MPHKQCLPPLLVNKPEKSVSKHQYFLNYPRVNLTSDNFCPSTLIPPNMNCKVMAVKMNRVSQELMSKSTLCWWIKAWKRCACARRLDADHWILSFSFTPAENLAFPTASSPLLFDHRLLSPPVLSASSQQNFRMSGMRNEKGREGKLTTPFHWLFSANQVNTRANHYLSPTHSISLPSPMLSSKADQKMPTCAPRRCLRLTLALPFQRRRH